MLEQGATQMDQERGRTFMEAISEKYSPENFPYRRGPGMGVVVVPVVAPQGSPMRGREQGLISILMGPGPCCFNILKFTLPVGLQKVCKITNSDRFFEPWLHLKPLFNLFILVCLSFIFSLNRHKVQQLRYVAENKKIDC